MRYLIIILSALALTACGSEAIRLSKPGGETAATGTLKYRLNPPHRLIFILDGKTYAGDVDSKEVDNSAELRKRFGANSKRYQAIFSGLDTTYHVHHYQGVLKSPDGATLTCEFLSSKEGAALGTCKDSNGQIYEVEKQTASDY